MCGLGGDESGVEVGGGNGPKEEGVRQGKNAVVVAGTGVVVRAAGQGISAVRSAWFMDEVDVVIAKRENVAGKATVDFLGTTVILEVLVVGKDVDEELGAE